MSVIIPDEILAASQLNPSGFCQEIDIHLFQVDHLTLGYASQNAGMQPSDFQQLLQQRNIPLYA
jgi:predicted HTH domain antitoxin